MCLLDDIHCRPLFLFSVLRYPRIRVLKKQNGDSSYTRMICFASAPSDLGREVGRVHIRDCCAGTRTRHSVGGLPYGGNPPARGWPRRQHRSDCSAFITACNPYSAELTSA